MAQVGVTAFSAYGYPDGKNDTQLRQEISGLMAINSAGVAFAITAWSITTNVVTFTTATQGLTSGQQVRLSGFGTSTFFNGQDVTVSATGLGTTSFQAPFTHANGSGTEAGSGTLTPQYATNGIPTNWLPMTSTTGGYYPVETNNTKPCAGSVRITSQAGSGNVYQYDPVHNTVRIVVAGTELANNAAIAADTIGFVAEFLKA